MFKKIFKSLVKIFRNPNKYFHAKNTHLYSALVIYKMYGHAFAGFIVAVNVTKNHKNTLKG